MTQLPQIYEHKNQQLVSARELHEFLGVQSKFADWIKNRIEKFDFIENQDYTTFSKNLESGGKQIEYALTIDMAKELSMVENNDKGREARRYFIQKEKEALKITLPSKKELAQMVIRAEEEIERLSAVNQLQQKELTESAPKVEYFDQVLQSKNTYTTTQIAKELGLSAKSLNDKLYVMGIQFKQSGQWLLYTKYANRGFTKTKTYSFTKGDGSTGTNIETVWTEKGREFIHSLIKKEEAA